MSVEILTKSEVNNADRVLLDKLDLATKRIIDLDGVVLELGEWNGALQGRIEVLEEAVQALGRGEPLPPIDGSGPVGPPVGR